MTDHTPASDTSSAARSGYRLGAFSRHLGEEFRVLTGDGTSRTMSLIEARGRNGIATAAESEGQRNFSILFCDAQASPCSYLPQSVYRIEHPAMEPMELFIVPIGPGRNGEGICYEAVFSSID